MCVLAFDTSITHGKIEVNGVKQIYLGGYMMEKRVLSPIEVAEILTVHRKTIYKMLHENKIPYIKAGDKYLISISALDRYLTNAGK